MTGEGWMRLRKTIEPLPLHLRRATWEQLRRKASDNTRDKVDVNWPDALFLLADQDIDAVLALPDVLAWITHPEEYGGV